ncbi:hypothetical protein BB559_005270 [Furculomyces boomerangus]|uniref:Uncharacterized protein n=1 Tax=Furculomyces boomerangus TaxID=61424 RepID=A0A2T9Y9L1_9FUNG|nr:hypothetical protein BB559_005270 [Furculomyces boomerangus]
MSNLSDGDSESQSSSFHDFSSSFSQKSLNYHQNKKIHSSSEEENYPSSFHEFISSSEPNKLNNSFNDFSSSSNLEDKINLSVYENSSNSEKEGDYDTDIGLWNSGEETHLPTKEIKRFFLTKNTMAKRIL